MVNVQDHIVSLRRDLWRIVETQEVAATREITDSAREQSRLEELLEQAKPPVPKDCLGLSYLLFTPFRYPPLDYGSRFGSTFERGIFYGSKELETAFTETAVYLWLFQSGPFELGPLKQISDQRTALRVAAASDQALDLTDDRFVEMHVEITDPADWGYTQKLGKAIREQGIAFFCYPSARRKQGTNIAVLSPGAFTSPESLEQQHWNLKLDRDTCWFGCHGESVEFTRSDFEVDNEIPHPALPYL